MFLRHIASLIAFLSLTPLIIKADASAVGPAASPMLVFQPSAPAKPIIAYQIDKQNQETHVFSWGDSFLVKVESNTSLDFTSTALWSASLAGVPIAITNIFPAGRTQFYRLVIGPISSTQDHPGPAAVTVRELWGSPFRTNQLDLTLGRTDAQMEPTPTSLAKINFQLVRPGRGLTFCLLFAAMVIAVFYLGARTSILRDRDPALNAIPALERPFSLARVQLTWWFLLVMGGYISLYLITGEFNGILNGTVLTVLGISAVTSALAGLPSSAAPAPAGAAAVQNSVSALQAGVSTLAATVATLSPPAATTLQPHVTGLQTSAVVAQQAVTTLQPISAELPPQRTTGFLTDILCDADGANLHRLQMVGWTLVYGLIFAFETWNRLAMPQLDDKALILTGLSSTTYVIFRRGER